MTKQVKTPRIRALMAGWLLSATAQAATLDFNGETSSALMNGLESGQSALQAGVQALRKGRYEEALTTAMTAITSNPKNFKAHLLLCLSLVASGENAKLMTHLNELNRSSPAYASAMYLNLGKYFFNNQQLYRAHWALAQVNQPSEMAEALLYTARSYEQQRLMDQAIASYQKLLAAYPDQQAVLLDLSRLYLVQKNYARVTESAEKYLQTAPDNKPARFNLSMAALLQGDYPKAQAGFARLAADGDTSVQLKTYSALSLLLLDRHDEALDRLKGLTTAESRVFETQFLKTLLLFSKGDFSAASGPQGYLMQNNAQDPLTHLFQAVLEVAQGNEKAAARSLKQASEQVLDFAQVDQLGSGYFLPDTATAVQVARLALLYRQGVHSAVTAGKVDDKPEHRLLALYRARAYWQQNEAAKAQQQYQNLIKQSPELLSAQLELADTHYHQGAIAEAISGYEKAARQAPDNLLIKVNLANLYNTTGQVDKAIADYQSLLRPQPNPYLLNQLAATLAEKKQDYPQSIKLAEQAAKLSPEDLSIKDTLAFAYLQSKQPAKAKPLYEKILETTQWNQAPQTFFRMASMYDALGEKQRAARLYELSLNTGHPFDEAGQAEKRLKALWGI